MWGRELPRLKRRRSGRRFFYVDAARAAQWPRLLGPSATYWNRPDLTGAIDQKLLEVPPHVCAGFRSVFDKVRIERLRFALRLASRAWGR